MFLCGCCQDGGRRVDTANVKLVDPAIRITVYAIEARIQRAWESVPLMSAKRKKKRKTGFGMAEFADKLDKLFNILRCNCAFVSCENASCTQENCNKVHINCSCPREQKVQYNIQLIV